MITKVGKNTALLMLVVLLLLISACGGGAGSSAGTNEKGAASEADAAGGAQVSDSGSGESVQGEKVVTLDSSVVYNEGEETVADTDQVSLVVTGYEMNGQDKYGEDVFTVKLRCENKTPESVKFICDNRTQIL